jgi:hypothetical protein
VDILTGCDADDDFMPTCTDNIVWRSPTRDRARTASRRSSAAGPHRSLIEVEASERSAHNTGLVVVEALRAADRPEELPSQVQGAGGRRRSARSVGAFDAASCASLLVELDVHPRVAMPILRPHALPTVIMGSGWGRRSRLVRLTFRSVGPSATSVSVRG